MRTDGWLMKTFRCTCQNALYFDNTACLHCGREVGFDAMSNGMVTLGAGTGFKRCANGQQFGVCNGAVREGRSVVCPACALNRTIPDLTNPANLPLWAGMEAAKRRVLYTLAGLGFRPTSKLLDPGGVSFEFLAPWPGFHISTGHLDGIITMNTLEADDTYRERQRRLLGEPYRTLVGHFRHEFGHYFWDHFFKWRSPHDPLLAEWRAHFGDERENYLEALQRHYMNGPVAGCQQCFITAYASLHPWEDWAETWVQYLQMIDAVETAHAFGWSNEGAAAALELFPASEFADDREFSEMFAFWSCLAPTINEIGVGWGHGYLYPFAFSPASRQKLHFVHRVATACQRQQTLAA